MPEFRKPDKPKKDGGGDKELLHIPQSWTEPRCHVCMSKYRRAIDRMIALGTAYSEISRVFGGEIDRRSISNHAKKHLPYEEAAVRQIIDHEAEAAQENAEQGIRGALARRAYLNTALHKAFEALLAGDVVVEPKDAIAISQLLDKIDSQVEGAALDELRLQFNAFVQAIREVCEPEVWQRILDRTKQILNLSPVAELKPAGE